MTSVTETLRSHYSATFERYGATSRGVDWGTNEQRVTLRYEKMLDLIRPGSASVSLLDVGCGFGGLSEFAERQKRNLNYTGIDVAENMIAFARRSFPTAEFVLGDIIEHEFNRQFEFVVCNGILTQKLDVPGLEMDKFAARLIRRMFDLCVRGVAFNVMTTKVNFFANNLYYRNPCELLAWCMNEITPHVRLDHSYPLFEYTMYLFRDPS